MENITATLEPFIPIVIIVTLTLLMTIEVWMPYLVTSPGRKRQRWHNVGNLAITFLINGALSGLVSYSITYAGESGFGLLYHLHMPFWLSLVLGFFLSDLNSYAFHRLCHKVTFFWRFHQVHHSDTDIDASSALRLHPFEFIFQATAQATILPLLGVSNLSFVIYTLFALPVIIFNHTNIRLPQWYEKYVSVLFVTPNWHRVHHSSFQPETDSNFSDVFSIWDRIFSSYQTKKPEDIRFGLERLRERSDQTVLGMWKTPFKPLK